VRVPRSRLCVRENLTSISRTYEWILDAINNDGKVLVHCNGMCYRHESFRSVADPDSLCAGGISLSPTFVVMFVMVYYQLSWEDALHMVQNRRYCISPNGGFLAQIKVRPTRSLYHLVADGLLLGI
jgi:hypothetical protein